MNNNWLRFTVLALVIMFIGLFYYSSQQEKLYAAVAEPAIEKMLRDISSWQPQAMRSHLSAAAGKTLNDQQLAQLLNQYRPLGKLVTVDALNFSRLMSVFSLLGESRISYSGIASFENGPAEFTLTLQESSGVFSIYNLTIQPAQGG